HPARRGRGGPRPPARQPVLRRGDQPRLLGGHRLRAAGARTGRAGRRRRLPPLGRRVTRAVLAGIFVGGAGRRMGGAAKGLLPTAGGPSVLDRSRSLLGEAGLAPVLVARHPAYASLALEHLDDDPPGIGPLGGLIALLRRAGAGYALALACDMPFLTR